MSTAIRENYFLTEVLTATPQKLHLMLIEGAIRFAEKAKRLLNDGQMDQAVESLIRAQEVVAHITTTIDQQTDPPLAKKVAAIYLFIFRSLVEAGYHGNAEKIADALRVLQVERETWRAVCGQSDADHAAHSSVPPPASAGSSIPPPAADSYSAGNYAAGFSIEA